jgi:hypothetical protein
MLIRQRNSMIFKNYFLLGLIFLFPSYIFSQPTFQIGQSTEFDFQVKEIAVNSNGEVLVLSLDLNLYLVSVEGNIENITDRFSLDENSEFTTIAGTRSSRFYIGTSSNFLFEYSSDNNVIHINAQQGLEGDSITSMFESEYLGARILYVGTNKELYNSLDYGRTFEKADLNPFTNTDYPCTVLEGMSGFVIRESHAPYFSSYCNIEKNKVRITRIGNTWDTIFAFDSLKGNPISLTTTHTSRLNDQPTFVIGTDQGVFRKSLNCRDEYINKVSNQIVNSFAELRLYPNALFQTYAQETYILAASDSGLFISSDKLGLDFSLVDEGINSRLKDVKVNHCTAEVIIATSESITRLQTNIDYTREKIDLTNEISMQGELLICKGDSVVLSSTAQGTNLYKIQWLKNGNVLEHETDRHLTVKDSGQYTIRYDHCIFDSPQITNSLNVNFYARAPIVLKGDSLFQSGEINRLEIIREANDSLYYVNDMLLDSNMFAVKSDTTVIISVLTTNNCLFQNEYSFSTILSNTNLVRNVEIYPNPFQNSFFIKGIENGFYDLKIANAYGAIIESTAYQMKNGHLRVETDKLKSGLYFVIVEIDNKVLIKKVLKNSPVQF